MRGFWTDERIAQLRERYPTTLTETLARDLGCSTLSVYRKACALRLRKTDEHLASLRGDLTSRFFSKVAKSDGCWLWTSTRDRKGYGRFTVERVRMPDGSIRFKRTGAHRFSYEFHVGPIPSGPGFHGTCVLHRCDNPSCVRPDHLFLGTNADNVRDMDAKGRRVNGQLRGSKHHAAILNEEQVREIVVAHRVRGVSQSQLGRDYGVSHSTINHIFTGRIWTHLGLVEARR